MDWFEKSNMLIVVVCAIGFVSMVLTMLFASYSGPAGTLAMVFLFCGGAAACIGPRLRGGGA